jgi:Hsp20/alpha crystallin family
VVAVELTVTEGMLRIGAERRGEDRQKSEKYLRQELRVGSFTRVPPLPEGVTESDVTANDKDGILDYPDTPTRAAAGRGAQEDHGDQGLKGAGRPGTYGTSGPVACAQDAAAWTCQ